MRTVLITIPWFLPAYKAGGPVQSIVNLVEQPIENVQYRIFCGNTDLDGTLLSGIEMGKWVKYNRRTEVWYADKKNRTGIFNREVQRMKPDLFFIIGIYDWDFTIVPLLLARGQRKIVSVRGMLQPGALSQKTVKKKVYLWLWKLFDVHKNVEFHASTGEEKKCVEKVFGKAVKVHVAGNFPRNYQQQEVTWKSNGQLNLVTVALISPMKNILLVLQTLKEIGADIGYHIFGPVKDPVYWQQCRELIRLLPRNIRVHYHGDVDPLQVEWALEKGHVFILPSKSENFGHAIYEALSAGKPVITSCYTPWNGLTATKAGINVSLKKPELAKAIDYFAAMNAAELQSWSKSAKQYADAAIDKEKIKQQYLKMFDFVPENR